MKSEQITKYYLEKLIKESIIHKFARIWKEMKDLKNKIQSIQSHICNHDKLDTTQGHQRPYSEITKSNEKPKTCSLVVKPIKVQEGNAHNTT